MRSYARSLASGTRLRVLLTLAEQGEVGVAALSRAAGRSQPLMSWHLRHLRAAGLVRPRRVGREVRYSLNAEHLTALHHDLTDFISGLAAAHAARADAAEPDTSTTVAKV